jgi:putative N-acetylmannosamine-6-phosphate epimerase
MSLSPEQLEQEAIETIREIAAMAAEQTNPESPGATMISLLISAYSKTVGELLYAHCLTLDEALDATSKDFDIIHDSLRKVAQLGGPPC